MLAIRLRRGGSKKRPSYRVVVTESTSGRDGRFVEALGYYDPRTQPETFKVDRERLQHWLSVGASPSATVRTLVGRNPATPEPEASAASSDAAEQTAS